MILEICKIFHRKGRRILEQSTYVYEKCTHIKELQIRTKKDALNSDKPIEFIDIFIMLLFGAIKIKLTSK